MYSVRMRASKGERHVSGAERIVEENEIQDTVLSLVERARFHERGKPDSMNISIEALKTPVQHLTSLPVTLLDAGDAAAGKDTAKRLLRHLGVPLLCINKAFSLLENGESMRGAIIMDLEGERLEPDKNRGIRATRMDITAEASNELRRLLDAAGLSLYYTHISEALVLATKVASVKGTIAELCWSDDPSYTAGYVASKRPGYLNEYINEIEKCPILVDKIAGIQSMPGEFFI